jgi:hypothetical protein
VPDAFSAFYLRYVNDSTVVVDSDTLGLDSSSANIRIYSNYYWHHVYNRGHSEELTHDLNSNSFELRRGSGDPYGYRRHSVNTYKYVPNPLVGQYSAAIQGVNELSGFGYDTIAYYAGIDSGYVWRDSIYAIKKNISFNKANDSTINFQGNLRILYYEWDTVLHYKQTDYTANTVTYQNFHEDYYAVATLIYNYATNKITFEQHNISGRSRRYLKIEQ